MSTVVLTQAEVRQLLPMRECIALMARALKALANDNGINPLRNGMLLPDHKGLLGMMPGYLGDPEAMG